MLIKNTVFISLIGFGVVMSSPQVFSAEIVCPINPASGGLALGKVDTWLITDKVGDHWKAAGSSAFNGEGMADCRSTITGYVDERSIEEKHSSFFIHPAANIDRSRSVKYGFDTYYKVVNTSSTYVNTHVYMYYRYKEYGSSGALKEMDTAFTKDFFYSGDRDKPAIEGIRIEHLRFYMTAAPSSIEKATMNIGIIELDVLSKTDRNNYKGSGEAFLTLSFHPYMGNTCDVNSANVTLPRTSANVLTHEGMEAEQENFTITANCSASLAGSKLEFSVMDNAEPLNNSDILTNTEIVTNNVGIKIYETSTNRSIFFNTGSVFGTLSGGTSPSVSKGFYARYYKKDNNPVRSGLVNAQASVTVFYK